MRIKASVHIMDIEAGPEDWGIPITIDERDRRARAIAINATMKEIARSSHRLSFKDSCHRDTRSCIRGAMLPTIYEYGASEDSLDHALDLIFGKVPPH